MVENKEELGVTRSSAGHSGGPSDPSQQAVSAVPAPAVNASDLLALACACEAAERPSRDLDARIKCALVGVEYPEGPASAMVPDFDADATGETLTMQVTRAGLLQQAARDASPKFTASLDVAMSLVPEGWVVARIGQDDGKCWWVELRRGFITSYGEVAIGKNSVWAPHWEREPPLRGCHGAPLALTAAALRAQSALSRVRGEGV